MKISKTDWEKNTELIAELKANDGKYALFAWLPTKLRNGSHVWLQRYTKIQHYHINVGGWVWKDRVELVNYQQKEVKE